MKTSWPQVLQAWQWTSDLPGLFGNTLKEKLLLFGTVMDIRNHLEGFAGSDLVISKLITRSEPRTPQFGLRPDRGVVVEVQRGTSSGRGAGARGPVQWCRRELGPCNAPGYPRLVQPQWTVRNSCVNRASSTDCIPSAATVVEGKGAHIGTLDTIPFVLQRRGNAATLCIHGVGARKSEMTELMGLLPLPPEIE